MARTRQQERELDPELLDCLSDVMDPQMGLSVVDLGLVCDATRDEGRIDVAITPTSQACPLGGLIVEEARARLARRFPGALAIAVNLVWQPPWKPERMTDRARAALGHQRLEKA